jgi:pimeloyl-ACP methyl ester carboxylesterase
VRGEFIDLDGCRLYCYASGSRGVGDPLVLVHGCFMSSHLWHDLLPRLPKGHRILVLDLLGHGRSDPPRGRSMTVAAHADRLAALLDIFGVTNATLVGHAIGAAIAARVAHDHPERIARLALIAPALLARNARDARVSLRMRRIAKAAPLWERLSGQWLASALHGTMLRGYANRMNGAHSLDIHLKWYRSRDGRDAACAQLRALATSTEDTSPAMQPSAIACPTSLIIGECDPYLGGARLDRLVLTLREATRDNTVVDLVPGAAHMIPEEASHRLAMHLGELLARKDSHG